MLKCGIMKSKWIILQERKNKMFLLFNLKNYPNYWKQLTKLLYTNGNTNKL
jgi:hypothetical protein